MAALNKKFFYHGLTRKYIIAFGALFSHIQVVRFSSDGKEHDRIVVPIKYGPKEKWLVRSNEDPSLDREKAIVLPRLSYEIINFQYNAERKQPSTSYTAFTPALSDPTQYKTASLIYAPVPYDIIFNLYLIAKSADEASQMIEQILPMFPPDLNLKLNLIPEMGISPNIPLQLDSVEGLDNWDGSFNDRREIIWTIRFTMQAFFYGPTRSGANGAGLPLINNVQIDFITCDGSSYQTVKITPIANQSTDSSDAVKPIGFDPLKVENFDPFGLDGL